MLVKSRQDIDYVVSIESGYHTAHTNHNPFGCTVVVVEKKGSDRKIGIDLDIEFQRLMTDKIPSLYPDIGVLVQKEYGAKDKDPFPYFTNNKLTRTKVLENAIYNVAIQL
jgi:non-canonical (house-cleaning) NTP pyrophosphatase